MERWSVFVVLMVSLLPLVASDTPANCTFDDIKGVWTFYESERTSGPNIKCENTKWEPAHKKRISLEYPDVAIDDWGNKGFWTMVYNQGFEVTIAGRTYFAFSEYKTHGEEITSICNSTIPGWSRDVTVRNWACFRGQKVESSSGPKVHTRVEPKNMEELYKHDMDYIAHVNKVQNSFTVKAYPEYETKTIGEMYKRNGGIRLLSRVRPAKPSFRTKMRAIPLPEEFDWRNVSGVNYVSPVRNQGSCGSCYIFASMAGLESRVRIMTRNRQKPVFSPQDVIECSHLSQGCEGGFPYLIAGRYAQEKGVVLEECNKYDPENPKQCKTTSGCQRHYVSKYRYVGGYFGGCNEEEMKLALLSGGPLMVGFEVYSDLMSYTGGIYHHVPPTNDMMLGQGFDPLEETNHAVLLVGYGVDPVTKQKFWSIKNSWGKSWGEEGYFRILRGVDECAIESMAVEVIPIPA